MYEKKLDALNTLSNKIKSVRDNLFQTNRILIRETEYSNILYIFRMPEQYTAEILNFEVDQLNEMDPSIGGSNT